MPTQRPAGAQRGHDFRLLCGGGGGEHPGVCRRRGERLVGEPGTVDERALEVQRARMAAAASGVSPVSRRTSTPSARKYATVSRASPRSTSAAVPHVSVPVLSKQSVSIRPNISTLYKSRASTWPAP